MRLVFSVDVEEEGLFTGTYQKHGSVNCVRELSRLSFVTRTFSVPLTLLVSHRVATDPDCARLLRTLQDELGAEIGAHLHHWATPPFFDSAHDKSAPPLPCSQLGQDTLRTKLETLAAAVQQCSGFRPTSFRMGRWDWFEGLGELLAAAGFETDSSFAPLRHTPQSDAPFADHAEPWIMDTSSGPVAEIPLTLLPVARWLPPAAWAMARRLPRAVSNRLLTDFRKLFVAGPQPVWFPLSSMRLATRLAQQRPMNTMVLFLHSSELLPGAHPNFPDNASVDALLEKIHAFLSWMRETHGLTGTTLGQAGQELLGRAQQ